MDARIPRGGGALGSVRGIGAALLGTTLCGAGSDPEPPYEERFVVRDALNIIVN